MKKLFEKMYLELCRAESDTEIWQIIKKYRKKAIKKMREKENEYTKLLNDLLDIMDAMEKGG